MESWKEFLLKALLVAGLIELLANRVFSRLAMHIPRDFLNKDLLGFLFGSLSSLGVIAYSVSYALACGIFLYLIYQKLKRPGTVAAVFCFLLLFILTLDLLTQLMGPSTAFSIFYDLASLAAIWMIACFGLTKSGSNSYKLPLLCLAFSYTCYYYFKVSQTAAGLLGITMAPPWVIEVFSIGELVAIINSLLLFFIYSCALPLREMSRPGGLTSLTGSVVQKKSLWILPSVLALSFLLARFFDPYMLSLVSTWSLGWNLYLPFPLYAIAIWLFSYTVLENIRKRPHVSYGLGLIFIAGYAISLNYQVLEAILGVSCISFDPKET